MDRSETTANTMPGPNAARGRKLVDPPEGGWGWIIVSYLFAINMLTIGILKSFGILSVALQETFKASMEQISWIGSIMSSVRLTAGPIAAIFCAKFDEKQTGILGGAMVSTGLFLSTYVEQIAFLYVSLGLVAGCGFAFLTQAAVLNTTRYFRRRLSMAYAISRIGTGLTFVLAPFIQYLLDEYGWQGSILILCGLTLHLIPLGMLNRPIYLKQDVAETCDWRQGQQKLSPLEEKKDVNTEGESLLPVSHHKPEKVSALQTWDGLEEPSILLHDGKRASEQNCCTPNDLSILEPREFSPQDPSLLRQMHSTPQTSCRVSNKSSNQFVASIAMPTDIRHKGFCREFGDRLKSISIDMKNLIDLTLLVNPMFIIFTLCSFFSQLAYFIPYFHLVSKAKALGIEPVQATLLICAADAAQPAEFSQHFESIAQTQPGCSTGLTGVVEIVAQLISGYIADRNFIKKHHYHRIYLLFCGAVNLLAPLAKTFPTLMVYIVFFAMFCGGYLTLLLPVLVDFIGNNGIQNGMGLFQFFLGIGCLIGPPAAVCLIFELILSSGRVLYCRMNRALLPCWIASVVQDSVVPNPRLSSSPTHCLGALHDFTKNYDASFQLAGSCYFLSFLILSFVPLAERKMAREANERIKDDSSHLDEEDVDSPCPTTKKECLQYESMV